MGKATVFYDELRFDTRDPDVTHVYMFMRGEGDCPHFVHGWHHKTFPATITTLEIQNQLWNGESNPLMWDREAPPAQPAATLFNPHEHVPVRAEELMAWRDQLLATNLTNPIAVGTAIADAITARLTMVPQWDKACPFCRAHEAMEKAIMDQQG